MPLRSKLKRIMNNAKHGILKSKLVKNIKNRKQGIRRKSKRSSR